MKAQYWAYRDRKTRKRNFRNLWILRINAACRQLGMTYSRFIEGLAAAQIEIDRRMLAELAVSDAVAFKAIVDKAVTALAQKKAA
jgi:large subunit ribosomal protein L20